MTAAVEKAHAIVKDVSLDNNKRTKQSVTLKKDANKKDLLHDLEQQQQRLTLEMQRMTRLLNDRKFVANDINFNDINMLLIAKMIIKNITK